MVGDSGARKPEKERFGLRAIILGQEHPQFGKMRLQPDLEPAPFFRILLVRTDEWECNVHCQCVMA